MVCLSVASLSFSVLQQLMPAVHSIQPLYWLTFLRLRVTTSNSMAPVLARDATQRDSDIRKEILNRLRNDCFPCGGGLHSLRVLHTQLVSQIRTTVLDSLQLRCWGSKIQFQHTSKSSKIRTSVTKPSGREGPAKNCTLPIYDSRAETPFSNSP